MLVKEFLEQVENEPLSSCAAPGHYMGLFLTILNEFRDEKCSVLLGKIMARMSAELRHSAGVQIRDMDPKRDSPHIYFEDHTYPGGCSEENPCCDRRGEYNGFASGPLSFTCPKHCPCHD